jgi:hypothetical protein
MARNAAAVRGAALMASRRILRPLPFVAAAAILLASACSGQPHPRHEQFVGKWKSSRLATPLHLHENGEWEIRTEEDSVLQYGVWQLQDRRMVWSIKMDGRLNHDENTVISVGQGRFELRERNGSVTVFERLD